MTKKSIIISTSDVPTFKDIVDTVSRLRKDYKLLAKIKGAKDIEDPESLKIVAAFLEMLAKREKRNLPKSRSFVDDSNEILLQMTCNVLKEMDEWELKQTISETDLGKIFEKELFDD